MATARSSSRSVFSLVGTTAESASKVIETIAASTDVMHGAVMRWKNVQEANAEEALTIATERDSFDRLQDHAEFLAELDEQLKENDTIAHHFKELQKRFAKK